MARGISSILSRIEAPVVDSPDMVSKKALAKSGIAPLRMYGNEPKNDIDTHPKLTIKYPSFLFSSLFDDFGDSSLRRKPQAAEISPE